MSNILYRMNKSGIQQWVIISGYLFFNKQFIVYGRNISYTHRCQHQIWNSQVVSIWYSYNKRYFVVITRKAESVYSENYIFLGIAGQLYARSPDWFLQDGDSNKTEIATNRKLKLLLIFNFFRWLIKKGIYTNCIEILYRLIFSYRKILPY